MKSLLLGTSALAFCAAPLNAATNAVVTLTDNQAYAASSYLAYLAPFGKGALVQGLDYTESMTLSRAAFPNGVHIESNWPAASVIKGVRNFLAVDFGDYNNTVVPDPIVSQHIKDITTLNEAHDLTVGGSIDGFDVIDDLFLTQGVGSRTTHQVEIEVFLHTPGYSAAYVHSGSRIGSFDAGGVTWTVSFIRGAVPDILFMPSNQADVPSGTVDLLGMLSYLVSVGRLTGNEYFNGMALGLETGQGRGSLTINSFAVTYR